MKYGQENTKILVATKIVVNNSLRTKKKYSNGFLVKKSCTSSDELHGLYKPANNIMQFKFS
jgi:hypothetical protein